MEGLRRFQGHEGGTAIIEQGAAGTTELVAAIAGKRIWVFNYVVVLGADGTVKFVDTDGDLTGAMPAKQTGGVSAPGQPSAHWFTTGVGKALSIVTTGGAAHGHLAYFVE